MSQKTPRKELSIEVVRSTSKSLSSMSEASAREIVATLKRHYTHVVMTNIDDDTALSQLIARKPDLVFLGIHYVLDDTDLHAKVWLSDALDKHNIRYTGSTKFAHRLGLNKHLAKQRIIESGLHTSPFTIVRIEDEKIMNEGKLDFPLFVKPSNKGGGQGIDEFSIVHTIEELQTKVDMIHTIQETDALIEEYLVGREFSIAVIANQKTGDLTAMPIELIAEKDSNGDRMLSRGIKSANAEGVVEVTDLIDRFKLTTFAVQIFKALGARDYGRIDVRYDKYGVPHFLEANLIPSLIDGYGSFPKAYEMNLGLTHEDMVLQIVRLALNRKPKGLFIPKTIG
jgi:D-alanine-D-alanine ligase